jgi:hypothetical protein
LNKIRESDATSAPVMITTLWLTVYSTRTVQYKYTIIFRLGLKQVNEALLVVPAKSMQYRSSELKSMEKQRTVPAFCFKAKSIKLHVKKVNFLKFKTNPIR